MWLSNRDPNRLIMSLPVSRSARGATRRAVSRPGPRRVVTGAFAVALVVTVAAPAGAAPGPRTPPTGPVGNAFYDPARVPRAAPGFVVWQSPIISPAGSRAWKVLYHSQALDGRDIVVSGIVITPTRPAPRGGWPVVSWAHGTEGLADACAPSKALDITYRVPGIRALIRQGYVVVATDYEGLGTPGELPYLDGAAEARGVLDIARAAHTMAAVHASTRVLVYGHSEGGQAALFAGQLASTYAPDLHLLGVAAVAPVSDVTELLPEATATSAGLGYAVMASLGYHTVDPSLPLGSILTPQALSTLGFVADHCADDVLDYYAEFTPAQIIEQNPLTVPALAPLLSENTAGTVPTPAPLFVAQGGQDLLVPTATTNQFVQRACAAGDRVLYRVYPGKDHIGVRTASARDIEAWMAGRVAGRPAPSTC